MAPYNNLGKISGELNYLDQAKKYYEKALNLNPNINETLDEYQKGRFAFPDLINKSPPQHINFI